MFMKLSKLLATRQALLRQTHLANLAFAYTTLQRFAQRIEVGNLRGLVRLRPADPSDDCYWATLTALEGSQSVLEEHFADQELIEFAEAMAFATDTDFDELEFPLEDLAENFLAPLRQCLEEAGVTLDSPRQKSNVSAENQE